MTEPSSGRRLLAWALFGLAMTLLAVAMAFLVQTLDEEAQIFGFRGAPAVLAASFAAVGLMLASRRPENPIGWIFLSAAVLAGMQSISQEYGIYALARGNVEAHTFAKWFEGWIWVPVNALVGTYVSLLFPTGRPPTRRWRWIAWTGAAGMIGLALVYMFLPSSELGGPNPFYAMDEATYGILQGVGLLLHMGSLVAAVISLVVRFRRSSGDERQQVRWLMSAAAIVALSLIGVGMTEVFFGVGSDLGRIPAVGVVVGFAAIPIATGVAVLKYRLYDLDVVISRAVLYGSLATVFTLIYIGIVVGIGAAVGNQGNVLLSVLATALIAIAFQPLRERVRRFANRLVYGKRATPYEVLGEFAERMGETYATEQVLPRLARLLGEGTGAIRAEVWLRVGAELRSEASWPESAGGSPPLTLSADGLPEVPDVDRAEPVLHHGELLGMLTVAKPRGESVTAAEEKLIAQVASQAGLVLRNVRLIEELQASRQRLVAAQDDERRRLERNIHDGAQQQLVALTVKMRLVETMSSKDPAKAAELARQAKGELQDALEDLRDLARGIYPPLLADQGLAAVLEAQARKAAVRVEVHPNGVGRYPKEVEAGAYFCVLEALQNVAKYADASRVDVTLRAGEGELTFEVTDDGKGFDPATTPAGSGLTNMRDRLEALGGSVEVRTRPGEGTTVQGRVPAERSQA